MAISTIDGLVAGFQPPSFFAKAVTGTTVAGRHFSFWGIAGVPGAGAYDTTLNGVTLVNPVNGQIPFTDPAGGTKSYLANFRGGLSQIGTLFLCDRLWHNGGFTITSNTAQNITSPTWPARDSAGATSGAGVLLAMEISATTGAGTPTITVSYTNSAGVSGRTATNVIATVASSVTNSFYTIGLQAGDVGVQSVQSVTLSATWTSGTMNLVAYRILAQLEVPIAQGCFASDCVTLGLPQVYTGTCPFLMMLPSTTTTSNTQGILNFANG